MISPEVIARFEQLQDMATIAAATTDGLRPEVAHWRSEEQKQMTAFESASRPFGRVDIRDGQPFRSGTREKRVGNTINWVTEYLPVPELDGLCADLLRVRARLAAARERLTEASERAAGLRGALDQAREALRSRGWKEPR